MQRVPFAYIMHSIFGLLTKAQWREGEREQPFSHFIVGQRRITVSVDSVVCLIEFVERKTHSARTVSVPPSPLLFLFRHVINNNLLLR